MDAPDGPSYVHGRTPCPGTDTLATDGRHGLFGQADLLCMLNSSKIGQLLTLAYALSGWAWTMFPDRHLSMDGHLGLLGQADLHPAGEIISGLFAPQQGPSTTIVSLCHALKPGGYCNHWDYSCQRCAPFWVDSGRDEGCQRCYGRLVAIFQTGLRVLVGSQLRLLCTTRCCACDCTLQIVQSKVN